ncbi:MAG: P1 family peptidase [Defluviitoga tunisiensis]|jgi:L-aminopeptidase/D-esterase-like protein|uniref:L-aminopeptidase/D-esterase n=1 Tax=Defluviitoga tunisiensis TaxID=1006576 RepID=A0A0C7P437_DEFTU|nr:P1 family peptidase [Defluviitoga tunisiensis]CEP79100.1 L-aminopeptidase/D-esterase [Defluviitoga tunisiensis]HOB55165.1 P1 family peptidase [Defluviitoga tunisiensis]HOP33842.1 P1 family peptidase [Defluviitoga tunisiensis]HPU59826.1 P1 family peptidase [Defluviitoga tunisiensis]HPZ66467.1 P1 family peptidase [Defluviitoga tunisiensis]
MNNTITAVPGIKVGHYTDLQAITGCTVILVEDGAVAGVCVSGSAPGTRETDLLKTGNLVQQVHAILLTGGSAFGLDAAAGVMQFLEEKNIGFQTDTITVPIVPSAVIYDLDIGNPHIRPNKEAGYIASSNATTQEVIQGSVGAGTGAMVGKGAGKNYSMKSGVGSSLIDLGKGILVGALSVVNATGDIYENGEIIAGAIDENNKFLDIYNLMKKRMFRANPGENTTLSVVATNARLTKEWANKIAQVANDGFARTIKPVHSLFDGDTVFCISTGNVEVDFFDISLISQVAAEAIEKSIINAVKHAQKIDGHLTYSDLF